MIGKFTSWIDENNILDEARMGGIDTFGQGGHNGGFGYYKQVIETLLNDEPVYLVDVDDSLKPTNDKSDIYLTKKDFKNIPVLKSFLKFAPGDARSNYALFNKCWRGTVNDGADRTSLYTTPIWRYIYKGQFTGGRGNNQGNAFEKTFADEFQKFMSGGKVDEMFVEAFNKILRYAGKTKKSKYEVKLEGKKNKKRSIEINGNDVVFSKRNELTLNGKGEDKLDIGSTVTDVTIDWGKTQTYISLKHGDTIEQVNIGISWARDDIDALFKKAKEEMKAPVKWKLNPTSKTARFCKFLGIDEDKLMWSMWYKDTELSSSVIAPRMHKINPDTKDNAPLKQSFVIKKGSPFYKFIVDCIGYGYVYVHYEDNKINCINLTKPESVDNIFNDDIKAQILYSNGASKTYVKINIADTNDFFNGIFEIRPNNGKLSFNVCNLKFNYNHENLPDVVTK